MLFRSSRVMQHLERWTGRRWLVAISGERGEPTLAEQHEAAEQFAKAQAANHPLVAAILATFPGATVEAVRGPALGAPPPESGAPGEGAPQAAELITDDVEPEDGP